MKYSSSLSYYVYLLILYTCNGFGGRGIDSVLVGKGSALKHTKHVSQIYKHISTNVYNYIYVILYLMYHVKTGMS